MDYFLHVCFNVSSNKEGLVPWVAFLSLKLNGKKEVIGRFSVSKVPNPIYYGNLEKVHLVETDEEGRRKLAFMMSDRIPR